VLIETQIATQTLENALTSTLINCKMVIINMGDICRVRFHIVPISHTTCPITAVVNGYFAEDNPQTHKESFMPRFFCDNINDNRVYIGGEDAKHITKVLRLRVGDAVIVNDLNKIDHSCEIETLGEQVVLCIKESNPNKTEPKTQITLYQALPKGDKFEFIVQKAVELGATTIVPMMTRYCVVKANEQTFQKKLLRLQKIAFESAKQCGRGIIPNISNIITFEEAIQNGVGECSVLYYEGGGITTNSVVSCDAKKVNIYIGSEGGFSEKEIDLAKQNKVEIGTLGSLILRCETAPIVAISLVLNATGHM